MSQRPVRYFQPSLIFERKACGIHLTFNIKSTSKWVLNGGTTVRITTLSFITYSIVTLYAYAGIVMLHIAIKSIMLRVCIVGVVIMSIMVDIFMLSVAIEFNILG